MQSALTDLAADKKRNKPAGHVAPTECSNRSCGGEDRRLMRRGCGNNRRHPDAWPAHRALKQSYLPGRRRGNRMRCLQSALIDRGGTMRREENRICGPQSTSRLCWETEDDKGRTTRNGKKRTARTGRQEKDGKKRTARKGRQEKDGKKRTARKAP